MYNFIKNIVEGKSLKLSQITLGYSRDALKDSISEETMNYHFGKLYKTYVDRFNSGDGDPNFNEAGAFLHSIYFSQFKSPVSSNKPTDESLTFIEEHYQTFDNFKKEFEKTAMKIQGSGWVYLARDGKIKTIKNHEIKNDILLLIDWWEHAWALDYQADKKKYLENQWKIIDWEVINHKKRG